MKPFFSIAVSWLSLVIISLILLTPALAWAQGAPSVGSSVWAPVLGAAAALGVVMAKSCQALLTEDSPPAFLTVVSPTLRGLLAALAGAVVAGLTSLLAGQGLQLDIAAGILSLAGSVPTIIVSEKVRARAKLQ